MGRGTRGTGTRLYGDAVWATREELPFLCNHSMPVQRVVQSARVPVHHYAQEPWPISIYESGFVQCLESWRVVQAKWASVHQENEALRDGDRAVQL